MDPSTPSQPLPNQPASTAPDRPEPVRTGKSADPMKMWVVLLAILFLAVAGFAVWQTLQLNAQNQKITSLEASKDGLQTELNALKGADPEAMGTGETTELDTNMILAAVDAFVRAPAAAESGTFEYNVAENADDFARVSVTPGEGGGYALWLKKVGDNWTVLLGGQSEPTQEDIDKYGIPEAILN